MLNCRAFLPQNFVPVGMPVEINACLSFNNCRDIDISRHVFHSNYITLRRLIIVVTCKSSNVVELE